MVKWAKGGRVDDESFYHLHYGNTPIPKDIVIRVRKVLVEQLGSRWLWVKPEDCVVEDDEIDFVELLYEMEEEFGVSIPDEIMQRLDASFDSIVRYLAGVS
jgi:acyl carrier protein